MGPKFTGVWVPKEILEHEGLTVTEKVAYGIIDGLDGEGGCYASNGYLARILGVSGRQVKNIVNALLEAGLITRKCVSNAQGSVRYLHTITKTALIEATKETNFTPPVKSTSLGGGSTVPPYRIEDKIEDIKIQEPLPYGSDFKEAWTKWVEYRKEIKKPMKATTIREQLKMMAGWGSEQKCVQAIDKSIVNGWQGVFLDKTNKTKTLTNNDHANGF